MHCEAINWPCSTSGGENPLGAAKTEGIRLRFDRRLRLEFRGAKITTDAGLLAVRELDEMMGLTDMAGELIEDKRTGKNIQHQVSGLLRQSVYARLAGYEDTNDHEGLSRDPAMRAVIGKRALDRTAASSGTVSRFETDILTQDEQARHVRTMDKGGQARHHLDKVIVRSLRIQPGASRPVRAGVQLRQLPAPLRAPP